MMKTWLAGIPMALALACPVQAACTRDAAPAIPDGGTASKEQMVATQGALKAYLASGDAYLACMQKEIDGANALEADPKNKDATAAKQASLDGLTAQYNVAVDEMKATGDQFNAAVRAFKAAPPK